MAHGSETTERFSSCPMGHSGSEMAYLTLFLFICAKEVKELLMLSMQQKWKAKFKWSEY